ncbi:MAG: hypothetical protein PHV47_01205 [Candidatus Pacebacteria bacterium]|nr:hypothetical protein [Candidatus Paceibacterota bacterium]
MKTMIDTARMALIGIGVALFAILIGGCMGWFEETTVPCPDCPAPGPAPCEDTEPEVVAVLTYDGCSQTICVDASGSRDTDSCGETTIMRMEVDVPNLGVIDGTSGLTACFPVPRDECGMIICEGPILITVWDNEGTANTAVARYTIIGDTATFVEEIPVP